RRPATLYNIALAQAALGELEAALGTLRRYLGLPADVLDAEQRARAQGLIEQLKQRLAALGSREREAPKRPKPSEGTAPAGARAGAADDRGLSLRRCLARRPARRGLAVDHDGRARRAPRERRTQRARSSSRRRAPARRRQERAARLVEARGRGSERAEHRAVA